MSQNSAQMFTAKDGWIIGVLALIGIALSLWIYLPSRTSASEKQVEVYQNGDLILSLPIDQDITKEVTDSSGAFNVFEIKNQTVSMKEANCHDSTCIRTGSISHIGETIVCLPHRLVVKIVAANHQDSDREPDAIVR